MPKMLFSSWPTHCSLCLIYLTLPMHCGAGAIKNSQREKKKAAFSFLFFFWTVFTGKAVCSSRVKVCLFSHRSKEYKRRRYQVIFGPICSSQVEQQQQQRWRPGKSSAGPSGVEVFASEASEVGQWEAYNHPYHRSILPPSVSAHCCFFREGGKKKTNKN